jgi:hypothetical protein
MSETILSHSEYGDIELFVDGSIAFLTQKRRATDPEEDDAVGFHMADIHAIIATLEDALVTWQGTNRDLLRDVPTDGEA